MIKYGQNPFHHAFIVLKHRQKDICQSFWDDPHCIFAYCPVSTTPSLIAPFSKLDRVFSSFMHLTDKKKMMMLSSTTNFHASSHEFENFTTSPSLQHSCFFIGLNKRSCQELFNRAIFSKIRILL